MSLLSGVLSGGSLLAAALGKAIDASHHPFKRATYRPGGPSGRADEEVHEWACHKVAGPKSMSVQKCENIHNPARKPKIVRINKAKKKLYNKRWRKAFKTKSSRSGRDPVFRRDIVAARAAWRAPVKAKKARKSKSKR